MSVDAELQIYQNHCASLRDEIARLRAALAEAEREKKSIRDTCVALNEHNDELDARLDEALARAERAEADLAAARDTAHRPQSAAE